MARGRPGSGGHRLLVVVRSGEYAWGGVQYGESLCGPARKEAKWAWPKKKIQIRISNQFNLFKLDSVQNKSS
jgi:hypothetical protein